LTAGSALEPHARSVAWTGARVLVGGETEVVELDPRSDRIRRRWPVRDGLVAVDVMEVVRRTGEAEIVVALTDDDAVSGAERPGWAGIDAVVVHRSMEPGGHFDVGASSYLGPEIRAMTADPLAPERVLALEHGRWAAGTVQFTGSGPECCITVRGRPYVGQPNGIELFSVSALPPSDERAEGHRVVWTGGAAGADPPNALYTAVIESADEAPPLQGPFFCAGRSCTFLDAVVDPSAADAFVALCQEGGRRSLVRIDAREELCTELSVEGTEGQRLERLAIVP
jgi:hypothetical protein